MDVVNLSHDHRAHLFYVPRHDPPPQQLGALCIFCADISVILLERRMLSSLFVVGVAIQLNDAARPRVVFALLFVFGLWPLACEREGTALLRLRL